MERLCLLAAFFTVAAGCLFSEVQVNYQFNFVSFDSSQIAYQKFTFSEIPEETTQLRILTPSKYASCGGFAGSNSNLIQCNSSSGALLNFSPEQPLSIESTQEAIVILAIDPVSGAFGKSGSGTNTTISDSGFIPSGTTVTLKFEDANSNTTTQQTFTIPNNSSFDSFVSRHNAGSFGACIVTCDIWEDLQ